MKTFDKQDFINRIVLFINRFDNSNKYSSLILMENNDKIEDMYMAFKRCIRFVRKENVDKQKFDKFYRKLDPYFREKVVTKIVRGRQIFIKEEYPLAYLNNIQGYTSILQDFIDEANGNFFGDIDF